MSGNHAPFMNKALSKAIMIRATLRNTFLKNRSEENKKATICREIIVFHPCKKVREINTRTLIRKTFAVILNFGK